MVRTFTAILTCVPTFQNNEAAKELNSILSREEINLCSPKCSDGLQDLSILVFRG